MWRLSIHRSLICVVLRVSRFEYQSQYPAVWFVFSICMYLHVPLNKTRLYMTTLGDMQRPICIERAVFSGVDYYLNWWYQISEISQLRLHGRCWLYVQSWKGRLFASQCNLGISWIIRAGISHYKCQFGWYIDCIDVKTPSKCQSARKF